MKSVETFGGCDSTILGDGASLSKLFFCLLGEVRPEIAQMKVLLDKIAVSKEKYRIESYGISDTRLEEVCEIKLLRYSWI